mgnify:CR=1 FL=1
MMVMQAEYSIKLRCATCGHDDHFEFNEDKSYVKCSFCNREYIGGIEELKELNTEVFDEVREQIEKDAIKHIQEELKKAFRRNKSIKFK